MAKEDAMQTIDRAIKILKSFSVEDKELSLADLHRELGLSKSSLQRILNTLVLHGLLDKDQKQKTYQLGMELYFLGQLVEKNSHLLSVSRSFMEKLRDKLGESVSLSVVHHRERKCIGYVPSNHELTTLIFVGQASPLYAGASAKILMAYMPEKELAEYVTDLEFEKITQFTIKSKEDLHKELEKIRKHGYAISYGERVKGAFSVSAPIMNRFHEAVAGLSLTIPTVRVDKDNIEFYIGHVKRTAQLISEKLV
ncbi:IclR family transcriptional regulator [Neobacillus niacini]|uniref:IclR family transcriptional regulator n=1 Tax=Neobacillus niacini TaxID=86668 RepID=UPI002FFE96CB